MKWHAQALHVARKDARLTRWLWLAYGGAVLVATANAAQWIELRTAFLWTGLAVSLVGMLVVATITQADSATRADAFWATRPLHPGAVYGAKLLGAAFILLLPLLGELVALLAHDVTLAVAVDLLVRPAAVYVGVLALAVLIAVLTRDLRMFLLAFLMLIMAQTLGSQLLPRWLNADGTGALPVSLVYTAATGGMLLLAGNQYRTRDARRGAVVAVLLIILGMLLPTDTIGNTRVTPRIATAPIDTVQLRVELEPVRKYGDRWLLPLRLVGESRSPTQRYSISHANVWLIADGERTAVELQTNISPLDDRPAAGLRPLNDETDVLRTYGLILTAQQHQIMLRKDIVMEIAARISVTEGRVLMEVPAVAGAVAAASGHRMRLQHVEQTNDGPRLALRHSTVLHPPLPRRRASPYARAHAQLHFELVNMQRNEAAGLMQNGETSIGGVLVLPGSRAWTRTVDLRTTQLPASMHRQQIDDAWLNAARLRVLEATYIGEYTARVATRVPRT